MSLNVPNGLMLRVVCKDTGAFKKFFLVILVTNSGSSPRLLKLFTRICVMGFNTFPQCPQLAMLFKQC